MSDLDKLYQALADNAEQRRKDDQADPNPEPPGSTRKTDFDQGIAQWERSKSTDPAAGGKLPAPTPGPAPVPAPAIVPARVRLSFVVTNETRRPVPGAKVTLNCDGRAPMEEYADEDGILHFELAFTEASTDVRAIVSAAERMRPSAQEQRQQADYGNKDD